MQNRIFAWAVTAALLTTSSGATQRRKPIHRPAARTVIVYTGEVNAKTADRFLSTMSRNVDKVIGAKVLVEPSQDGELERTGYLAIYSDNQLGISLTDRKGMNGGVEVVKNGPVQRMMGSYSIDGMFLVKPGGLNQGVASFGLEPVDEASVRLNQSVRIVERPF
jgi:hypothetical protein